MPTSPGADDQKLIVPKFSSFKSEKPPLPETTTSARRHNDGHRKRSKQSSDEHRNEKRPRKERDHRSQRDSSSVKDGRKDRKRTERGRQERLSPGEEHRGDGLQSLELVKLAPARAPDASPSKPARDGVPGLFLIDTQGDKLLKKYGADRRYWVPGYRRLPRGKVLGDDGRLYLHRDGPREQFSILMPGEKPEFWRFKDGLRSKRPLAHPNPVRLSAKKIQADADEDTAFIAVVKPNKRKRRQSDSESSIDESGPSYRSIEGKMKSKQVSSSEEEDDSDEAVDVHQDNPLRWRSVQLNRQVKEHPEDLDAWLELVDHQDALLKAGHSIDDADSEHEAHSYGEIKVSMLESALSAVSLPDARRRILPRLMQEGIKVWDRATATKKWADLSEEERDSFEIWKTYLDYRMTDIATFQYEKIKEIMLTRLHHLVADAGSSTASSTIEEAVFVFLRLTRFVADAGYTELAISAWQALFEMNYFRPTDNSSETMPLEAFRDFWESEVPRIGETAALGWRDFVQTGGIGEPPDPRTGGSSDDDLRSRDPYKIWTFLETKRQQEARFPARTMDEDNDDDPYRVVMFSDIERFVFWIPVQHLQYITPQITDAFLVFSGLPPAFTSSPWTSLAQRDPCLTGGQAPWDIRPYWDLPMKDPDDHAKQPPSFTKPLLRCAMTPEVLFPGPSSFRYLSASGDGTSTIHSMTELVIAQLVQKAGMQSLGQYSLALTSAHRPEKVKGHARALLKQFPTDIDLYNAYALAEVSSGHIDVAEKVLGSAVGLAQGKQLARLILTWSWMKLELGSKPATLRCLCSMANEDLRNSHDGDQTVSSTQTLKASQTIRSAKDAAMYSGDADGVAMYGEYLMLFTYVTAVECAEPVSATQGNVSAAMDIATSIFADLRDRGLQRTAGSERLLQAASKLLYWHASKGLFRRHYVREQVLRFLAEYPQNGIFLSLLEWSDSSLRVIDETRDLLYESCLAPAQDRVSNRVFAIAHEMARGNVNSTRAAFEHAVSSDACRASSSLWVWYIQFMYSQKQLRPKAKDVFYRALKHCPWSKQVMMQAFVTLIRVMESDELRSVYNTMTSKGIRVHVELDDHLEKFHRSRSDKKR